MDFVNHCVISDFSSKYRNIKTSIIPCKFSMQSCNSSHSHHKLQTHVENHSIESYIQVNLTDDIPFMHRFCQYIGSCMEPLVRLKIQKTEWNFRIYPIHVKMYSNAEGSKDFSKQYRKCERSYSSLVS